MIYSFRSRPNHQVQITHLIVSSHHTHFHIRWIFFGIFALGTIARLKPCFAASAIRSCHLVQDEFLPRDPTSPKITKSRGKGRLRKLDTNDSNKAKSALVSVADTANNIDKDILIRHL